MHPEPLNPAADHLRTSGPKLSLGCPILNSLLNGGLPAGTVTEIAAESSSGKTQLSLQLLLSAALPPFSSASLFIHSQFPFPIRRLQILSGASTGDPLDDILVTPAHSPHDLLALLYSADALLARPPTRRPLRLIVVDSLAALFCADFDNTPKELKRRSSLFFKIASKLKEQAVRFRAVVVVTNHVVDVVDGVGGSNALRIGNFPDLFSSGRRVCPALGLSWANCVNIRLFLSRIDEIVDESGTTRTRRKMQLLFAPHLPPGSCEFVIVKNGVFGVENR